ncbi:MAG TPA: ABC transporter ATP-binding protein [Polyangiaceae bacterium]|nr:ABC transporter ATP-binding protein [Polyangiaceae bacterium]
MTQVPALSAKDVSKRVSDGRSRREVLKDISLDLHRGEMLLVRGPSGSGKTTLLAILGGMLLPTSGEVCLGGEAISRLRDHQRAEVRRAKVGFVFQDFGLIEGMTVLDNVLLPLVPPGNGKNAVTARAMALLDALGIGALAPANVTRLSGGERQRVALARARIAGPEVLLLDEPTAHLDTARAEDLMADLARLCDEGAAVLVASHDARVDHAARVDRRLDLRDGLLV